MNNTSVNRSQFWNDFSINCLLLTKDSLKINLSSFWKSIMSPLEGNQLVYFILKVKFTDGSYASLSHMQIINKTMFKKLLNILYKYLDFNSDNYTDRTISNLIFQYHIKTVEKSKGQEAKLTESYKTKKVPAFRFKGYNLPISTDLEAWGLVNKLDNNIFKVNSNTREYKVTKFIDKQVFEVMSDNKVLFSFTDIFGENSNSFTRILKDKEFIYKNGELIVKKLNRKTDFITKIKVDKQLSNKFITLDIETKTMDNVMVPYCVSIYDGSNFKSFYLTSYSNSDDMLSSAISYLLKRSYDGYKVYIHNLSHFDGIFLFRILSNYENSILTPVMKDGKMISLRFSWKPKNFSIRISFN